MSNLQQLTKEQAIILTGFTGILMCDFSDFHADVETRMGRPIFTHEFANGDMTNDIANLYRTDFMKLIGH